jgi:hypothetical protein
VGVNIHFTRGHERDLDLMAGAGFKVVRMDFGWAATERSRGQYDWLAYEELLGNLEQRGMRALFILDYSNPLYEEKVTSKNPITGGTHETVASPQRPESVAAFARWAGAAAGHFKGRGVLWEIWNEPNIHFWSPQPDVGQYITLALAASQEIRRADPEAAVFGPATSGFPWDFLESCFKAGLLEHWDAVSVHPYRDYKKSPESAVIDYERLRGLVAKYAPPAKRDLPILSGEWGYATHQKGLSLELQAAFAARQQLVNLYCQVPVSVWYDWKNDGPDPAEREHNFGTVTAELEPKPAYVALRTLTRTLAGFRVAERVDVGNPGDWVLRLVNSAGEERLAGWTTGEKHLVQVPAGNLRPGGVAGMKSDGAAFEAKVVSGHVGLELEPAPIYAGLPSK